MNVKQVHQKVLPTLVMKDLNYNLQLKSQRLTILRLVKRNTNYWQSQFTVTYGNNLRLGTHFSCDPVTVLSAIYTHTMKTYPHQMTFTRTFRVALYVKYSMHAKCPSISKGTFIQGILHDHENKINYECCDTNISQNN